MGTEVGSIQRRAERSSQLVAELDVTKAARPGVSAVKSAVMPHEGQAACPDYEPEVSKRFCACLEGSLPECIVGCLEGICLGIYNCLASILGWEQAAPQPEEQEAPKAAKPVARQQERQVYIAAPVVRKSTLHEGPAQLQTSIKLLAQTHSAFYFMTATGHFYTIPGNPNLGNWLSGDFLLIKDDADTAIDMTQLCTNISKNKEVRVRFQPRALE